MANYAITSYRAVVEHDDVASTIETYLETVDDSKTIYLIDVEPASGDRYMIIIIHAA